MYSTYLFTFSSSFCGLPYLGVCLSAVIGAELHVVTSAHCEVLVFFSLFFLVVFFVCFVFWGGLMIN